MISLSHNRWHIVFFIALWTVQWKCKLKFVSRNRNRWCWSQQRRFCSLCFCCNKWLPRKYNCLCRCLSNGGWIWQVINMTLLIWYCYIISSRPIAGYVNFCSSGLNANSDDDFIFAVAKHEFLHALVSNI